MTAGAHWLTYLFGLMKSDGVQEGVLQETHPQKQN